MQMGADKSLLKVSSLVTSDPETAVLMWRSV